MWLTAIPPQMPVRHFAIITRIFGAIATLRAMGRTVPPLVRPANLLMSPALFHAVHAWPVMQIVTGMPVLVRYVLAALPLQPMLTRPGLLVILPNVRQVTPTVMAAVMVQMPMAARSKTAAHVRYPDCPAHIPAVFVRWANSILRPILKRIMHRAHRFYGAEIMVSAT